MISSSGEKDENPREMKIGYLTLAAAVAEAYAFGLALPPVATRSRAAPALGGGVQKTCALRARSPLRVRMTAFDVADGLHKDGKIKEAIDALGAMEESDSFVRRSRWTVDLSDSVADKDARLKILKGADEDAAKAIEMDEKNFAAWKAAAIVKGKMQKCVGTNEKVALTKEVKENIEKALELNPEDGASWHVLGMWHTGVSNLNFMMKAALKALFGGMPEASHEKAIECFLKADKCKPNLTTTVELAKVDPDLNLVCH
jgi:tetratricopeptide (TPR) repeat protein